MKSRGETVSSGSSREKPRSAGMQQAMSVGECSGGHGLYKLLNDIILLIL